MKYCKECVLPDTRPNLEIDESGVCNACRSHAVKKDIPWAEREKVFCDVVERAKRLSKGYDCVIPVSGGKDSTWSLITCLRYGLNPLAVTWKTPVRTEIGRKNLENLVSIGVDHIDYQVNPLVEKKFMLKSLKKYGTTAIPMHMALFNIPMTIAATFGIPLVVWGENSAFEYGTLAEEHTGFSMNSEWLRHFGVTHGTTALDWVSDELTKKELTPFFGLSDDELEKKNVLAVFLGYYFEWDPEQTFRTAMESGFSQAASPRTGYYNFADIDDDFISIHHYLKWYKFGFTRLFDNLSLEIRNGRMTREEAIEVIKKEGDQTPHGDIAKLCAFIGITMEQFFEIIEPFRNRAIWSKPDGKYIINDFIIPDWRW